MQKQVLLLLQMSLLIVSTSIAQISQSDRIEIDTDDRNAFGSYPFEKNKKVIATYLEKNPANKKEDLRYTICYNENLREEWKNTIISDGDIESELAYTDDNKFHNFVYNPKTGDFHYYNIEIATKKTYQKKGNFGTRTHPREMIIIGNYIFIAAEKSHDPFILTINIQTGESKLIEPVAPDKKKFEFQDLELIKTEETSEACFQYSIVKSKSGFREIGLIRFNANGVQIDPQMTIVSGEEKEAHLLSVSLTKNNNDYILFGTYGKAKKAFSNGIFFARLNKSNILSNLQLYNFLDIKNFTQYMTDKQQNKIERKKNKAEENDKELLINYNVKIHDIKILDDRYIFLGEFYFPTYRTESYTTYINGRASTTYRQVFDGFQYSHAALASFDKVGHMVWSNSFEMWLSYKPYYPKEYISIGLNSDINLTYITGASIRTISFNPDGHISSQKDETIIDTGKEDDKIKRTASNSEFWFGKTFLGSGYQTIKNKNEDNKKRNVYFINKITF